MTQQQPGAPDISVVIMGYRNAPTVLAAVRSVVGQATTRTVEVIVVTSGDDATASIVRGHYPDLEVVESPTRLLAGGARNLGVSRSRGRVVAFLAADCQTEPGWIAGRLARHDEGFSAVAAAMTCAPPRRPASLASCFLLFALRLPGRPPGVVDVNDTAAHGLSYDRAVLDELGPFDETVIRAEDTAMAHRLGDRGIPIWFDPAVRTAHTGPLRTRDLMRDQYRRSQRKVSMRGVQMHNASRAGLVRVAVQRAAITAACTVREACRSGGDYRLWALPVLPWIVLGAAASQWAWLRAQLSARRLENLEPRELSDFSA